MKLKNFSFLFLTAILLGSCGGGTAQDIATYTPNLPEYKNKNDGAMLSDDTYDYLDIYEISDYHGAFTYDKTNNEIGLTRLGTYFDAKRETNPGGTILISGGDMWQGSADSNLTRGNLCTYAMNIMNFDSMTMGNHEFDWGKTWINNNKEKAKFPLLAANIIRKDTGERDPLYDASTIITRGDYKIGIIGTIGDNIEDSIMAKLIEDVEFTDEIPVVKAEASRLREEEDCDVVIWSSHRDAVEIYNLAVAEDPGVDAIFGGHSHSTGYRYNATSDVAVLQSDKNAHSIPHTRLKINKETKEVSTDLDNTACDEMPTSVEYTEDADIKMVYDQYDKDIIGSIKLEKLGSTDQKLVSSTHLANYCVKAMHDELKRSEIFGSYEIAATFTNVSGGVRANIEAGDITYGDVYTAFPFDNSLVIIEATGGEMKRLFYGANNTAKYTTFNVEEYNAKQTYYILTTDFLESNKLFFAEHAGSVVMTDIVLREAVANQIRIDKNITAKNYSSGSQFNNPFSSLV